MKIKFDTKTNPQVIVSTIDKKSHLIQLLNNITDILCTSYICAQYGWFRKLNQEQQAIIEQFGDDLGRNLGIKLNENYNDNIYIWARWNKINYGWLFKLWVGLNKKYFDVFKKPHKGFRYSVYLLDKNIYI